MSNKKTITITLAGQTFEVPPLRLGQVRDLMICVLAPDGASAAEQARINMDRQVNTIAAGLSATFPQMTAAAIYDLPITRDELNDANDAVLKHSGLVAAKKTAAQLRAEIDSLQKQLAEVEAQGAQPAGELRAVA